MLNFCFINSQIPYMKAFELTKPSMLRVVNYLIQYRVQTEVYTQKNKVCMLKQVVGVIGLLMFNINAT